MLEYVLVVGIGGWEGEGSAVPNTTDRSVVDLPNTFDLYLYEDAMNGGGRGGNYSATIELGRTVPPPTDLKLYHPRAILIA